MGLACETDQPLIFFIGDTWTFLGSFTLDGAPIDLTGQTIKILLKNSDSDPDSAHAFEYDYAVPSGPDATAGNAVVVVPSDQTGPSAIDPADYFMKVQLVAPGTPPIVQSFGYTKVTVSQ